MRIVFLALFGLIPLSACQQNAATGEWEAKKWGVSVQPPQEISPSAGANDDFKSGNDDTYCTPTQKAAGEC